MIDWADIVLVMEQKHQQILKQRFDLTDKQILVLDIEDNYRLNDPELINILNTHLQHYL